MDVAPPCALLRHRFGDVVIAVLIVDEGEQSMVESAVTVLQIDAVALKKLHKACLRTGGSLWTEKLHGIDYMINAIDTKRSELGAIQNRLESTIRNQENVAENVSDSRAQIRDADYAEEVSKMTSAQMLQQGSVTILTQANSKPQIALQMLQDS